VKDEDHGITTGTRQNGSKFDIRKFHEKMLESGVMIALLEKRLSLGCRNKMTSNYSYELSLRRKLFFR
jgi:hypothetical protein